MKGNQEYNNGRQLHIEDYLQENKLETEGITKVPSILDVSPLEEIDTKTVNNELLEKILSRDNMNLAFKRVKANKGASGIDNMPVDELLQYLKENGEQIKESIRKGKYNPKAVKRGEISKADGSKRKLGIPTVVDRVIHLLISIIRKTVNEDKVVSLIRKYLQAFLVYTVKSINSIEPLYAERHVQWCERTLNKIIIQFLLDCCKFYNS